MGSLGSFTPQDWQPAAVVDELSFEWFGTQIRVHPEYGEGAYLDFVETVREIPDNSVDAVLSVKTMFRETVIHPDDFAEFWRLGKAHRWISNERLADLNRQILEAITGRPTGQPTDSSAGPATTPANSEDASSSPGTHPVVARLEAQGRPDLALVVLQAQESATG